MEVLQKLHSVIQKNTDAADSVFTKIFETETIDKRDLQTDGEEALEKAFVSLDRNNPAYRITAMLAIREFTFQKFKRDVAAHHSKKNFE